MGKIEAQLGILGIPDIQVKNLRDTEHLWESSIDNGYLEQLFWDHVREKCYFMKLRDAGYLSQNVTGSEKLGPL